MSNKKSISPYLIALFLLIGSQINGQQVDQILISSAGSNYQSNSLQIDFSIGQLVNTTANTSGIIVTQGFHQSFSEMGEALATSDESIEIHVFPNPTRHLLTIATTESSTIYYTLYDLNGAKVARGNFKESIQLAIDHLARGTYQLFLTDEQERLLEAYKVQFK